MKLLNNFFPILILAGVLGMIPARGQAVPANMYSDKLEDVPVLCYHQIRDWKESDTKADRTYIMPIATFRQQMQMLHDSGYHTILPDQLIAHVLNGAPLPKRPVLLTFDDGTASQYEHALPELNKYGFKAVFFIMTVALNKKNYLSTGQIKDLVKEGHIIGCHTWDHHSVTEYKGDDWKIQVQQPAALLGSITNMPVKYFAYPYGLWDRNTADKLKNYGFSAAFQLWGMADEQVPLFTIKRILVDGNWDDGQLSKVVKKNYR